MTVLFILPWLAGIITSEVELLRKCCYACRYVSDLLDTRIRKRRLQLGFAAAEKLHSLHIKYLTCGYLWPMM